MRQWIPSRVVPVLLAAALPWLSLSARAQTPTTRGDRPPVRIVPQFHHEGKGLIDPTGRFAVARAYDFRGLQVVDLKRQRVAWVLEFPPLGNAGGYAFSHDGGLLALCGSPAGQILDLAADHATPASWLNGALPVFAPDDKLLYVTANSKPIRPLERDVVDEVQVYDLQGKKLRSYPLQMNIVGRMSFSDNGRTLVVEGGMGVSLGSEWGGTFAPAQQTIDLDSGKSQQTTGAAERVFGGSSMDLLNARFSEIPVPAKAFNQRFARAVWDASTGALATVGQGGWLELWGLKEGTFKKMTGQTSEVREVALQGPGLLVGTAWYDYRALPPELAALVAPPGRGAPRGGGGGGTVLNFVTQVHLPGGESQPVAIPSREWLQCLPSPDGRYIAGLIGGNTQGFTFRVPVWDTKTWTQVGEIVNENKPIMGLQWTGDGRYLIMRLPKSGRSGPWEFFTPQGKSDGTVPGVEDFGVTFSPSGDLMAVPALGPKADPWTDTYRTSVRKSRTGEELASFDGGTLRAVTLFLDDQRLLVAGRNAGDPLRLIRLSDRKVLWETKAGGVRSLAWEPGLANIVLRYEGMSEGADVLSLNDGQRLPAGADGPTWHNPTLILGGRLALDPLCGSTILQMRATATGRLVATLAGLGDSEWIIYTPEGKWMGSPKALDWVSFYRGSEPLPEAEIAALRQPEAVKAQVAEALR